MRTILFPFLAAGLLLFLTGCPPVENPPDPQIVVTVLDNDVYQFTMDNGKSLDIANFLVYLDEWIRANPQVKVNRIVPQQFEGRVQNGKNTTSVIETKSVLVFCTVDRELEKKLVEEQKKKEAAEKKE